MAFTDIVGSTNLLTKTVDFSANFPVRRATKTNNAGTAPDGTNTALSVIADTNNNTHRLDRNPAGLSASTQYTFSAHLKAFGLNHASLTIGQGDNGLGNDATCVYNLSTGVVESEGSDCDSSSIETLGNGWYRCSMTLTLGGSISVNAVLIGLMSDATTTNFTGNNTDGILVWGPQLEEGANQSQYLANDTSSTVQNAGSNNTLEFDNSASASLYSDSAAGANSTIAGGVRSYKTPNGKIQKVYIKTRRKGEINHYLNSESVNSWINNQMTITQNATKAPDGLSTAEKVIPNTNNTSHFVYQNNISLTGPITFSVFAKPAGYNFIKLYSGGSSICSANFNLATGTVGTTGGSSFGSAAISILENGWYRCQITNNGNVSGGVTAGGVYVTSVASNPVTSAHTEAGDGTSGAFIWGAMLSDGAIIRRYVKTTGSASSTIETGELSKTYYDGQ